MPKKKEKKNRPKRIENKKAHFQYQEMDLLEVGMVLNGEEIKAIRKGHMQLAGSYGRILQGSPDSKKQRKPELWLVGAQVAGVTDKQRSIKLLAHRNEIDRLLGLIGQKGYTLVPNKVYMKHNRAKLELMVAKGAKEFEKRARIRERDINRDISRAIRSK